MSDYGTDILEWSEHQALLLRHIAAGERLPANNTPDWTNIIDEVESVGRSQVDAIESLLFPGARPHAEGGRLAAEPGCRELAR